MSDEVVTDPVDNPEGGGPAFPSVACAGWEQIAYGMTLRDHFAAKAMSNLILDRMESSDASHAAYSIAEEAYQLADAMLKERAK